MDDLIEFLRARLDEDEQMARAATWCEEAGVWHAEPTPFGARGQRDQRWFVEDALEDGVVSRVDPAASDDEGVARHIARHDPARVLREVEAKRKLLDNLFPDIENMDGAIEGEWGHHNPAADRLLEVLALPYADHDDYKEDWRP